MKKYLILLFLALLPAVVPAQESDSLDVEQPATSYTLETVPNVYRLDRRLHVSDPTGILSSEARSAIDRIFTQLEDSTGIQTAVVMLPSIGEDNIFDFAHNLFRHWGIGNKDWKASCPMPSASASRPNTWCRPSRRATWTREW